MARKVKMNISIASPDWSFVPGQIVELEDYVADAWVEAGNASELGGEEHDKKKSKGGNASGKRADNAGRGKKPSEG